MRPAGVLLRTEDINHNLPPPRLLLKHASFKGDSLISGMEIINKPEQIPLAVLEGSGIPF